MTKEQDLYNNFVDVLNTELKKAEVSPKSLDVIQKFIAQQGLQATRDHKGLNELTTNSLEMPFEDEDVIPITRVK